MSLRGIPSSNCHLINELATLSGLDITEYGGYNTFIPPRPGEYGLARVSLWNEFMTSIQNSSIIFISRWLRLENMMYISLIYVHNFCSYLSLWIRKVLPLPISFLDESQAELVETHLPYRGNQESLKHVRACIRHLDGWEGPALVLGTVWWVVWAENGLHPSRVKTSWSPPASDCGPDPQDELCWSTRIPPRQPA